MPRVQMVSDAAIMKACEDAHAAGKPVSVRAIHAVTGGDYKRINRIIAEFREQNGLDPLRAGKADPDALTPEQTRIALDFMRKAMACARSELESYRVQLETDAQESRDDRDDVINQNSRLLEEIEGCQAEIRQHQQTIKDQEQKLALAERDIEALRQERDALKDALEKEKNNLVNEQRQRLDDRDRLRNELTDLQRSHDTHSADHAASIQKLNERINEHTLQNARLESEQELKTRQLLAGEEKLKNHYDLVKSESAAVSAQKILESQLSRDREMIDRLNDELCQARAQIAEQASKIEQLSEKAGQTELLTRQMGTLERLLPLIKLSTTET